MMPPAMNNSKKLIVRMALATGSTFATIIGAQSLAVQTNPVEILDASEQAGILPTLATLPEPTLVPTMVPTVVHIDPNSPINTPPTLTIQHTAPNIIILRQPGQTSQVLIAPNGANTLNPSNAQPQPSIEQHTAQIVPPQPQQVAAPPPMVIQPDPIIVQPPPTIVQASAPQSSNNNNRNNHDNSGGGGSHRSHSS